MESRAQSIPAISLIAEKEFRRNITTFKFTFSFSLAIMLVSVGTFAMCRDYEARLQDCSAAENQITESLRQADIFSALSPGVVRAPSVLTIFRSGLEGTLGDLFPISIGQIPTLLNAEHTSRVNPFITPSPSPDLTRLVIVILSVLAMLFGYEAISGEKEMGTLKMVLAQPVPRSHVLLGKLLGGLSCLVVPLSGSFLIALMISESQSFIQFAGTDWIRISLIFFCSLLFLSSFYLMGIVLSTLTHRASATLLSCFMIWVILILVIPNLAPYLGARMRPITSSQVMLDQITSLDQDFKQKVAKFEEREATTFSVDLGANFVPGMGLYGLFRGETRVQTTNQPTLDYMRKFIEYVEPLRLQYAEKVHRLYEARLMELRNQARLIESLSRLSPAFSLAKVASILAGTDAAAYQQFSRCARHRRAQFIAYLKTQNAFTSMRYFTSQFDGGEALDFEKDVPAFRCPQESIQDAMRRAGLDIVLLIFEPLLLVLVALVAFLHYDVR